MTPAQRLQAARLRKLGWSWRSICIKLSVTEYSLRSAIDPHYIRKYTATPRDGDGKPVARMTNDRNEKNTPNYPTLDPNPIWDSLTAFILGDPPIGRRAIDRMPTGSTGAAAGKFFPSAGTRAASAVNNAPAATLLDSGDSEQIIGADRS